MSTEQRVPCGQCAACRASLPCELFEQRAFIKMHEQLEQICAELGTCVNFIGAHVAALRFELERARELGADMDKALGLLECLERCVLAAPAPRLASEDLDLEGLG